MKRVLVIVLHKRNFVRELDGLNFTGPRNTRMANFVD